MTVSWGIAGTGAIATSFAEDLSLLDGGRLAAVGSRTPDRAAEFATQFGIPNAHGSYDDLAADPSVDVVYVATPQSLHCEDVVRFLRAGKHVLCEKPFALDQAQAKQMVAAARENDRFLMEAMWSRFLPPYRVLADLLASQAIGEPRLVEADFGFAMPRDPTNRLFDPHRGGGGLLDLGIYPLQLASFVLGTPDRVAAVGHLGSTGVDEQVAAVLGHANGTIAVIKAAITTALSCTARISGTLGAIEIPGMMHCPSSLTLMQLGKRQVIDTSWEGHGLRFQAAEVHRCLAAGLVESPVMPLSETVAIMGTLDSIRQHIGLTFPSLSS